MTENNKLTSIQAILFVIVVMINKIILNFPKKIIQTTDTGSLVNLIYIGALIILFCLMLSKLFSKFPNEDIIDISEYIGGKYFKIFTGLIFIFCFLISILTMIVNFSFMLKTIYFKMSPLIFIFLFFIIGITFANIKGFKSIIKTNTIIMPFMLLSVLIVFIGTAKEFKFEQIAPILGNNLNQTFLIGTSNLFAFSGIAFLYFLMPMLKNKSSYKKISLISMTISWIFLFISVLSLLLVIPFGTYSHEINSLYSMTRLAEYGDFLQRTDALFIFLWILSSLSYLSIEMYFIIYITKKIVILNEPTKLIFPYVSILIGFCLILSNETILQFVEDNVFKYGTLLVNFGISTIIMIIAFFKKKNQEEKQ